MTASESNPGPQVDLLAIIGRKQVLLETYEQQLEQALHAISLLQADAKRLNEEVVPGLLADKRRLLVDVDRLTAELATRPASGPSAHSEVVPAT